MHDLETVQLDEIEYKLFIYQVKTKQWYMCAKTKSLLHVPIIPEKMLFKKDTPHFGAFKKN